MFKAGGTSGVPQVGLRVTGWALLWEVRTSHWMNPVSFIKRKIRGAAVEEKQNCNTTHGQHRLPKPHLYPHPLPSPLIPACLISLLSNKPPVTQSPFQLPRSLSPNLVHLDWEQEHAAACCVCPQLDAGFGLIFPPWFSTPAPEDKRGIVYIAHT